MSVPTRCVLKRHRIRRFTAAAVLQWLRAPPLAVVSGVALVTMRSGKNRSC